MNSVKVILRELNYVTDNVSLLQQLIHFGPTLSHGFHGRVVRGIFDNGSLPVEKQEQNVSTTLFVGRGKCCFYKETENICS